MASIKPCSHNSGNTYSWPIINTHFKQLHNIPIHIRKAKENTIFARLQAERVFYFAFQVLQIAQIEENYANVIQELCSGIQSAWNNRRYVSSNYDTIQS